MSGVYLACSKASIKGTLNMLRYYRGYIRSSFPRCVDVECHGHYPLDYPLDKEQCQRRLWFLVNAAINRKAGMAYWYMPSHLEIELWRDCQLVQHLVHRNNPSGLQWLTWHPRKFRTRWIQRRYGKLLDHYWEMREE